MTGRALRQIAIDQIAELTNATVEAKSVDFDFDGSVIIKKLVIRPEREEKYDDAILKAETVYAHFSIGSLLLLRPHLKEIIVDDFVFDAQYDLETGRWNVAALTIKVPKGGSGQTPLVHLKRGALQYSKVSGGQREVAAAVPVDGSFGPAEKRVDGYRFNITTAERAEHGKSTLTGFWQPGRITIDGGISSSDVPGYERALTIDVLDAELNYDRNNVFSLKLKIEDLLYRRSPTLDTFTLVSRAFLEKTGPFNAMQRFFNRYQPSGRVDINLEASGNLGQLAETTFQGEVYCKDVSICDSKFPYAIEHLIGRIDITENSSVLNSLRGEHGDVKVTLNAWSKDFGPNRRYQVQITSDNMALDNDLYNALSTKQKKFWSAFSPGGLAEIDYRISRKSETDKEKTLAVELLDAEATYRNFPYLLKNLTGKLFFDREAIKISNVVSQYNGRQITLNGEVTEHNTERPIYDILIEANNIPLDSTLTAALPDKDAQLRSRFDTAGSIHIQKLTGRIWRELESKQSCYSLSLDTKQAELNEDWFRMLPPALEKVVSQSQAKGKINCHVDLNKTGVAEYPDYRIIVDCLGNSVNFEQFSYPLKDINGRLTITKESITLADMTATAEDNPEMPGANTSTIKIDGQIALADNAFSSGRFRLLANDILFDERLRTVLPEGIQSFYHKLSPTGRFDLNFENIKITCSETSGKYVDFAGDVKFKDCNFNTSPALTEMDAVLKTKGLYKTGDRLCDGQAILFAEGLKIKGKSLTSLEADMYYDQSQRSWLTKSLIADCYGGRLTGKLEFKQPVKAASQYLLQVGFDNIDLKQFLSDTKPKETSDNSDTSGKMSGSLSINGRIGDSYSQIGRCRLRISDMQVGKLSPLAKLLSVLQLTEPKDFAFERMFVDSYIKRNRLFFKQLDLSGQAVAFNGSGWMDLQSQNVDLLLTARGPRLATAEPSVLQSLTDALGTGVVRMEVTGNVYDPQVETTTLPVIKDSLGILGTPR